MNKTEIENGLSQFTGTEQYHRFSILFRRVVITDGVKWMAEKAGAFWLLDAIASYQPACLKDKMLREFQVWTLTTEQRSETNRRGHLKGERDTGDPKAIRQEIEYTDFPLDEIKLYVEPCSAGQLIMLPSER